MEHETFTEETLLHLLRVIAQATDPQGELITTKAIAEQTGLSLELATRFIFGLADAEAVELEACGRRATSVRITRFGQEVLQTEAR
jgi:CTP-dependent riboflavin kinase